MCTPQDGHETELAGVFSYCLVILGWFPHLLFTALVEAGVSIMYALIAVSGPLAVGFLILSLSAPWDKIVEESNKGSTNANDVTAEILDATEEEGQHIKPVPVPLPVPVPVVE